MSKKIFKKLAVLGILLISVSASGLTFVHAQSTSTVVSSNATCPKIGTTPAGGGSVVTYDQYEACLSTQIGADKINATNFFPKLNLNDLIGLGTTLLLSIVVIVLMIRIVFSVFKWVSKSGDEKERGAAIKTMTNGIIGVFIAFSAYFVVLFLRGFIGVDGQLVQCGNSYFKDDASIVHNVIATKFEELTSDTQRCLDLSGQADKIRGANASQFQTFSFAISNPAQAGSCREQKLFTQDLNNVTSGVKFLIPDRAALNKCFADKLSSL